MVASEHNSRINRPKARIPNAYNPDQTVGGAGRADIGP